MENCATTKKKKTLISFLSYDQDDFEYKKHDESFMQSFSPPQGQRPKNRHEIWRPSVALAQLSELDPQYQDLIFDDYYILWDEKKCHQRLKEEIEEDIQELTQQPPGKPQLHFANPGISKPFDTQDVYQALYKFLSLPEFHAIDTQYYVNCANGTTQIRNCLFLFTQTGHIDAFRIAPTPWENHMQRDRKKEENKNYVHDGRRTVKGSYTIENPEEISRAFSSMIEREAKSTIDILMKGVTTNHTEDFDKVAHVINAIKKIESEEFRKKQSILITGETGVGKTNLAQNMAAALGLASDKFVHCNCATLRGADANIQKIELFGATDGTANVRKRDGLLKKADGGMLFLDEVGELHPEVQAMLLTALDTGAFTPFGGDPNILQKSTFQLVCGTNRSLELLVATGKFRRDLLNRINSWHFKLKPLRERRDDIRLNVDKLVIDNGKMCGIKDLRFDGKAKELFLKFAHEDSITWDGNFRELNAMIARMVVLSDHVAISEEIVKEEIKAARERYASAMQSAPQRDRPVESPTIQPEKASASPDGKCPAELLHKIGMDSAAYTALSPIKRHEINLLLKTIYDQGITSKKEICEAVYGSDVHEGSLYYHLQSLKLRLNRGKLTYDATIGTGAGSASKHRQE